MQGLSPRVRGNLAVAPSPSGRAGSIPARAGEPPRTQPRRRKHEVYPRACGGTFSTAAPIAGCMGLSPRVRGNPGRVDGADLKYGLSPRVRGNQYRNIPLCVSRVFLATSLGPLRRFIWPPCKRASKSLISGHLLSFLGTWSGAEPEGRSAGRCPQKRAPSLLPPSLLLRQRPTKAVGLLARLDDVSAVGNAIQQRPYIAERSESPLSTRRTAGWSSALEPPFPRDQR